MSSAFPERALKMWGVSFRPVQMAKQESEERGAADTLYTPKSLLMTTPEQL